MSVRIKTPYELEADYKRRCKELGVHQKMYTHYPFSTDAIRDICGNVLITHEPPEKIIFTPDECAEMFAKWRGWSGDYDMPVDFFEQFVGSYILPK